MGGDIRISVVTPSFNQVGFVERTLLSVKNQQTAFGVEHIVVDGVSTDGSLEVLKRYEGQIRLISEPDRGMSDALNKGFALCRGDIIGWLNTDDLYLPGTLARVAEYFDTHPECLWVYGKCRIIDEEDREIRQWITAYKNQLAANFRYNRLLLENYISQPAVFMRRDALAAAGPLDLGLPTAMDYDLWLRFAKLGKPGFIDEYLAAFRVHRNSISSKQFREQFEEQYAIHKRYDRRWLYLFLNRVHILKAMWSYMVIHAIRDLRGR
jgi:GT2 family glycosyltransferase